MRRIHRAYLRQAYRLGGIEAINRHLLRVDRTEEILSEFGASIGADTVLHGPLVIHNAVGDYSNLHVGDTVHIGRLVILDLAEPIRLERDTVVSMGCTILTHSDVGERPLARLYPRKTAPVRIGPGAYLGANVTVLAGCDIGFEAVVGAGGVVTRPVPDRVVVTGVPALPIADSARE
jgi:acetyltransferase-like isoleucine patch superfamily enzyme